MRMPPHFHVTGNPNADWIIFIIGALVCLYWLRALRLAREGSRSFLRNLVTAFLVFCCSVALLTAMYPQLHLQQAQVQLVSGALGLVLFARLQNTKRSRHISKSTRRAVIERDLKGEKY